MSLPPAKSNNVADQDPSYGITRRHFLESLALTTGSLLLPGAKVWADSTDSNAANAEQLVEGWEYFRGSLGGIWDVWRTDETEITTWQQVKVPHCFNAFDAVDPDRPFYEGPCWYRRKLQLRNPYAKGRSLLHLLGAGQKCEVFIFSERVATHVGGYDEFVVDITDAVTRGSRSGPSPGEIPLAVLCDNGRDPETIPSSLNDFHRFGGLYRPVSLVYVPDIAIDQIHIRVEMSHSTSSRVTVKVRLQNPGQLKDDVHISLRIVDPHHNVVRTTSSQSVPWDGDRELANFQLDSPELWSPSRPSLYRCEVQLASPYGTMTAFERFGCRYFEFLEHGPFTLNGERLFLRGTHREEDHAGLGAAMPEDLTRQEILLIKEMGANFLSLAHHQQSRAVLDACDELGLLVLEEIPWSRGGLGGEEYKQRSRNMLRNMIEQHYNHPSIVLWGIGNENDWPGDFPDFDKQAICNFVSELNHLAHELDPGRKTFLRRCDFCKDVVDVYSPSIWAGWYHGPYTQYRDKIAEEMTSVRHFLHLEWGAESHPGRHSEDCDRLLAKFVSGKFSSDERESLLTGGQSFASRDGDWSETYACNLLDWHLKEQENMPQFVGSAQWIFKDFSTPLRADNPIPHVNQKGLMERDLKPKEGYYVFQSYWSEKPMIHIYGHSWPIRWGEEGELKLVKVYSNCETAELFLNGVSQATNKRRASDFPAAGLHWLVKFRPGENHLRAVGRRSGMSVEDEVILQYQAEAWGPAQRIELREVGKDGEKVRVEARLVDANGRQCLGARDRIRFGLTGDGVLLDNLGTVRGSRSVELCNGRAEISLATNRGKSVVSARIPPVPTAFLTVQ